MHVRRTTGTALTVGAAVALLAAPTTAAAQSTAHDPGEGHDKPAVVEDNNRWHLRQTLDSGVADHTFVYGSSSDSTHVMGDWDGDGERTPGVIRFHGDRDDDGNTDMVWYLRNSNTRGHADIVASFGEVQNIEQHDIPVVGDWDGDGDETIGVVRPDYRRGVFQWLLKNSNTGGNADLVFDYGPTGSGELAPDDPHGVPVVGDWDGDGTTTVGVNFKRPNEGSNEWLLRNSNGAGEPHLEFYYGVWDDRPLTGDWDGDGTDTVAVHRFPNHWFLTNQHRGGNADVHFRYGSRAMRPLVWR